MMQLVLSVIFFLMPLLNSCFAYADDNCLGCHEKKTPGIVDQWKGSVHFKKQVGCVACHGRDIEANHKREVVVSAVKCGACHKQPFDDHRLSKHSIGFKTGRGCTRNLEASAGREKTCILCHEPGSSKPFVDSECAMFLAQSPEMQRQGCDSCHRVETGCDTCHTKHGTDAAVAKDPATCGTCHMGPDHAQYEMWETSLHGVIYRHKGEIAGPSCVTCHMNKGTHNISRGIATGIPEENADLIKLERELMLGICSRCHSASLAKRTLDDADTIEQQGRALVEEAKSIIEELHSENLLLPMPSERPPHPLSGYKFIIGPHMLYENLSSIESSFFRMKQFYYMNASKGAFHQNPDYTHWYGNAPLKLTLSEIKSEALLLRQVSTLRKRLDNLILSREITEGEAGEIKNKLRELNERRLRGSMTEKEYRETKDKILKEGGL